MSDLYLPALARLGWMTGIEVTDLSDKALQQVQSLHPWVQTRRAGFAELLADPALKQRFDAVVVALPNSLHVPAVTAALAAGLPVLCEKPLAMSQKDCELLATLADEARLPLMAGMVRRLTQAARTVREALQKGLIGELQTVRVENGGPYAWTSASGAFFKRENGGILADLGVHHLDWLGSLLGPLSPVSYEDDARGGVEASCRYALEAASGVQVQLHLSHLYPLPDTTTFTGSKGTLTLSKGDFATCQWRDAGGHLMGELRCDGAFEDASWPPDFLSCFAQQFVNFSKVVHGLPADWVPAGEAAATMGLIGHAYAVRDAVAQAPPADDRPALPSGRTVVTGGSGFIGTALVARLAELGFQDITVPVRGYQTCAGVARYPVHLPQVDLNDRAAVRELVKGARWVFHLAYGNSAADARKVTVEATKVLVEEAAAAGVEAVIVLSTTWVYGTHGPQTLVDETSPYLPAGDSYGKTKAVMQQWCLQAAQTMDRTRLVVINPSCVYGPEGKTYTTLPGELARAGHFAWVNEGTGTVNHIYIDNLIDAILLTASRAEAHGKAFIASDGWCTWREFLPPLLPADAGAFSSFTEQELEALERSSRARFRDVLGSLIRHQPLRTWVRERSVVQALRSYLPKRLVSPARAPAMISHEKASSPAPWLRAVFGTGTTRYSSDRLKTLGWQSRITLSDGLAKTRGWLRGVAK